MDYYTIVCVYSHTEIIIFKDRISAIWKNCPDKYSGKQINRPIFFAKEINRSLDLDGCISNTNTGLRAVIEQIAYLLQDIAFTALSGGLSAATQIDMSHLQQLSACPLHTNHLITCAR